MTERSRISQLSGTLQAEARIDANAASADTADEFVVFKNTFDADVKVVSVDVTFEATLTGRATDHVSLQILNKGLAGSGTKAVTTVKAFDNGVDATAFVPNGQTLGAAGDLTVLPGEVLTMDKAAVGNGQIVSAGVVNIGFQFA